MTVQALPFVRAVGMSDGALAIMLDDPDAQNQAGIQAPVAAGAAIRYAEPARPCDTHWKYGDTR